VGKAPQGLCGETGNPRGKRRKRVGPSCSRPRRRSRVGTRAVGVSGLRRPGPGLEAAGLWVALQVQILEHRLSFSVSSEQNSGLGLGLGGSDSRVTWTVGRQEERTSPRSPAEVPRAPRTVTVGASGTQGRPTSVLQGGTSA
jgi:hypothetical protein